jgi:hypothetical protein
MSYKKRPYSSSHLFGGRGDLSFVSLDIDEERLIRWSIKRLTHANENALVGPLQTNLTGSFEQPSGCKQVLL